MRIFPRPSTNLSRWIRAKPNPCRREASVNNCVCHAGSNGWTTAGEVKMSLAFSNSTSCSGSHSQAADFFNNSPILTVECWRSGTNAPSWFASPRKDRRSLSAKSVRKLKTSPLPFQPMGATSGRYLPLGNKNAHKYGDFSSSRIWKYPCKASNFANHLLSDWIWCIISGTKEKGWTGRFVALFNLRQSTTILTLPPGFGTK
ncbi:uncharacterized protein LOC131877878 [Tigriopus californicus]|uniref:uncharacterized protein LOC131877878 n=1 Tax=Tigriopus californicus TaxID=6832 RepID=UPI0027D9D910|nr:uncharacterized protein LOC131877878 [Tigriopus californicus]